eukprot:TRINITY_DN36710_c0_g2_i2.p1 TRINITY_DN36710_c0_g2~~TRINITY_DN36710_c0_g2_i2.p1  ORF type:complete len:116 (+),score=0.77 TRINITY_DN36710_c0_g2_i2:25-372(+)
MRRRKIDWLRPPIRTSMSRSSFHRCVVVKVRTSTKSSCCAQSDLCGYTTPTDPLNQAVACNDSVSWFCVNRFPASKPEKMVAAFMPCAYLAPSKRALQDQYTLPPSADGWQQQES